MKKNIIEIISYNSTIAALYVILTYITFPISYGQIQFRFAECLILLCFFRKDYIFGLTIGCAISNLLSTIGLFDVLFGSLATFLSCLFIIYSKHLLIAIIFPILFNSVIVGFELFWLLKEVFWLSCLFVGLGELGVMLISYIIYFSLRKKESFYSFIRANQNTNFKF